ncbi:hypothetical protein E3N88_40291 [Mikania micrantha]|uniref:Uncharacterized protein n=1 Tax=Mikania micrantha TaxID=192012 RepID=A0A5N6LMB9_9ASTR|nr:hypothetical protein E3N88_40291 [Mikania micrantha]
MLPQPSKELTVTSSGDERWGCDRVGSRSGGLDPRVGGAEDRRHESPEKERSWSLARGAIGGDRRTLRHESPAIGDSRSLGGTIGVEDGREGGVNSDCLGKLQRSHEQVKLRNRVLILIKVI